MQDFEKLGVFHLGRLYDLEKGVAKPELLLLKPTELVTHALVVGMTGSGKTSLCFDLIEEAAIDGIPSILIDPKGDLANLLLTFPHVRAEDFGPWINEEHARQQSLATLEYAARQTDLWREGLARWGHAESSFFLPG